VHRLLAEIRPGGLRTDGRCGERATQSGRRRALHRREVAPV